MPVAGCDATTATERILVAIGSGGHDNLPTLNKKSNAGALPRCPSTGSKDFSQKNCQWDK